MTGLEVLLSFMVRACAWLDPSDPYMLHTMEL